MNILFEPDVVGEGGYVELEWLGAEGDALMFDGEGGNDMDPFGIGDYSISVGVGPLPGRVGQNGIAEKLEGDVLCLWSQGRHGGSGIGDYGQP